MAAQHPRRQGRSFPPHIHQGLRLGEAWTHPPVGARAGQLPPLPQGGGGVRGAPGGGHPPGSWEGLPRGELGPGRNGRCELLRHTPGPPAELGRGAGGPLAPPACAHGVLLAGLEGRGGQLPPPARGGSLRLSRPLLLPPPIHLLPLLLLLLPHHAHAAVPLPPQKNFAAYFKETETPEDKWSTGPGQFDKNPGTGQMHFFPCVVDADELAYLWEQKACKRA